MEDVDKAPSYEITNVVATFNLGNVLLDIRKICQTGGFFEFNPKSFAAATGRLKNPKCSGLFFASGSVVLTGAASEAKARLAAWCFVGILRELGCDVTVRDFTIQNIVCNIVCGRNIKLYELHAKNSLESNYTPVLFPGLIYRYPDPKMVFVTFLTGNVIGTGAKVRQQLEGGWHGFYHNKLKHYFDNGEGTNMSSSSSEYRIRKKKEHDTMDEFIRRLEIVNANIAARYASAPPSSTTPISRKRKQHHFVSVDELQQDCDIWIKKLCVSATTTVAVD